MWVSVNSKTKNYQIYQEIILLFIFLYQLLTFWPLQPQAFLIGMIIMEAFGQITYFLWWIIIG